MFVDIKLKSGKIINIPYGAYQKDYAPLGYKIYNKTSNVGNEKIINKQYVINISDKKKRKPTIIK